jgi:hypothetical protein
MHQERDMPAPPRHDWPQEQRLAVMENARRQARFLHARNRIDKIASGDPPLTVEQLAELARRLTAGDAA